MGDSCGQMALQTATLIGTRENQAGEERTVRTYIVEGRGMIIRAVIRCHSLASISSDIKEKKVIENGGSRSICLSVCVTSNSSKSSPLSLLSPSPSLLPLSS